MLVEIKKEDGLTIARVGLKQSSKNSKFERVTRSQVLSEVRRVLGDESIEIKSGPSAIDNRHGSNLGSWILDIPELKPEPLPKKAPPRKPSPRKTRPKQEKKS